MNYNAETIRESGFYSNQKWLEVRDSIRKRDKMTCKKCGTFTAKYYEVDHIQELTWENVDDWNVAYNPDNLQLLCHACHNRKTRKDKRSNYNRLFY